MQSTDTPVDETLRKNATTHEHEAARLALDYIAGDLETRRHIAETCEEQGILAALVVLAMPPQLRPSFVRAMKGGSALADVMRSKRVRE